MIWLAVSGQCGALGDDRHDRRGHGDFLSPQTRCGRHHDGNGGPIVVDVDGDHVDRIRVEGHGDQVEFETFEGQGDLEFVGAEWDA